MIIEKNRVVSIDYTLTDDKGAFIDSTGDGEALDYLHGHGNIISGLEQALEGKKEGDHINVHLSAAEAYGDRDDRLVIDIPRENLDGIDPLEEGMQFQAQTPDGYRIMTIRALKENSVTMDGNHPLAGMALTFDVRVSGVREASETELARGHIHHHDHENCGEGCGEEGCGRGGGCCGG
ncbi:MAG: peptidylprolyl isomerase [Treponema sp.]|jgi:FKBP-type peptidyl-prolyl cis-trans isomerase SlyD|nr:peptidylprolyl isomerase [Treponema sp.]